MTMPWARRLLILEENPMRADWLVQTLGKPGDVETTVVENLVGLTRLTAKTPWDAIILGHCQGVDLARIPELLSTGCDDLSLFRSLFDHAQDGLALADPLTTRLLRGNAAMAAMLGVSIDEIPNLSVSDIHPAEDLPWILEAFHAMVRQDIAVARDVPVLARDGSVIRADIAQFHVLMGQTPVLVGSFREVTERFNSEQALRQAKEYAEASNRAKNDFLAMVGHEIRTPLNIFMGSVELLLDSKLDPDQTELIMAQKRAGESLLRVFDGMLEFIQLDGESPKPVMDLFHLPELISSLALSMEPSLQNKDLRLETILPEDLTILWLGDSQILHRILTIFLDNSIKFTREGVIRLRLLPPSGHRKLLRLEVEDTGIGIAADQIPGLFQPFFQADSTLNREYEGAGLGLAIARRLAMRQGGEIGVESEPGKGSRFWVTLPFQPAPDSEIMHTPPRESNEALRILLVEDSADTSMIFQAYLKKTPHELVVAEDGLTGFEIFAGNKFDIVFMDLQMPRMDGYTATRAMRDLEVKEGWERTPIMALSAHALALNADKSRAAGCDRHLVKPLKKDDLMDILARTPKRP